MSDLIAAIATGASLTAIGVIRLSGEGAIAAVDRVFCANSGKPLSKTADRKLVLGKLHDCEGCVIDECLVTVSRAPNSYTGEETAELQCHGSPLVLRLALESLFAQGARQALAGEFTKRAFLNGRMDLMGAEAVVDLINSETAAAAKNAVGQLSGALSRRIEQVYGSIADLLAHFQAVVDYPDEDIEPTELDADLRTLRQAEAELQKLQDSFKNGRTMNSGLPTAILGRPNAGKSSLLNALLGYERAIVTDIPGTTRDTISERATLGDVLLRLTDTAGLRETADKVEAMGVERSREAMRAAELIFVLCDSSVPFTEEDAALLAEAEAAAPTVLVWTKSDLPAAPLSPLLPEKLPVEVRLSAVTGDGFDALRDAVGALFPPAAVPAGEILTNARQVDAVARARESVAAACAALEIGVAPDAALSEAEAALAALGELTGRTVRSDVTDRIFSRFCVGK